MRFWRRWRGWIWGSRDLLYGGVMGGRCCIVCRYHGSYGGHDLALLAIDQNETRVSEPPPASLSHHITFCCLSLPIVP